MQKLTKKSSLKSFKDYQLNHELVKTNTICITAEVNFYKGNMVFRLDHYTNTKTGLSLVFSQKYFHLRTALNEAFEREPEEMSEMTTKSDKLLEDLSDYFTHGTTARKTNV